MTGKEALPSSPLEALLRGGTIERFGEPFDGCVMALDRLQDRLEAAKGARQISGRDKSWVHHALNLVASISALLREEVTVVEPGNTVGLNRFHFGRLVRPYDLEFLRDVGQRVYEELGARPAESGPCLVVLVPYLQTWADFIIPSALGDLEILDKNTDREVAPSARVANMLRDNERLRRIGSLERQAEATLQNLKEAAGEGGNERLAQTFDKRGEEEATSAANWNRLVMLFVALGIALPLGAISLEDHFLGQLTGPYSVVIKALIGLPLFALATYCGRIPAQHRRLSQHMKTLTAQIDSVKAYVATLPEEAQQDIISGLGRRAFSEPGVAGTDGTVGLPPEQILPTLEKAVDGLKALRK